MLCVEIQKNMTLQEVSRALGEFEVPEGHDEELIKVIYEKYGPHDLIDLLIGESNELTTKT